ncbi:uncharacterized protein LOC121266558 [Juglans microcarpa x Juglans regia]|uniref:uncharacterized protein LOC121266558 n=1 Tax=Juglans microcarpa x Juglans regia TaxID=2249226 RepID=UPI001B7E1DA6|nr:uncharacterized protein LOC121266558 [Juglans microcarpa x Juglans regia]
MGSFFNYLKGKLSTQRAMIVIATPFVIFAGISMGYWALTNHLRKGRPKIRRLPTRSMSIGALHGGKLALQRLVDYHEAHDNAASLHKAETELVDLLKEEQPDLMQLQRTVAKLEMSGKEEEAVAILEKAVENAQKEKQHEAYEIEMLLVEMLIYKGDFEKALNCECLKHEEISDARRPLYKAIIYIMLGKYEQAKKCWGDFKGIQRNLQWPPSLKESQVDTASSINHFKEFEKVVKFLKDDIHKAQAQRMAQN